MRQFGFGLLLVTFVVTMGQIVWLGPQLPDPVASHFNGRGQADGWSSRTNFLVMHAVFQLAMCGLLLGIGYASHWFPDSLINMPNKDYWLHPKRRTESLRKNRDVLVFIAGITGLFLAVVFHLVYIANVQGDGQMPTTQILGPLAIYFLLIGIAVCRAMLSFRLPKDATGPLQTK